MKKQNRHLSHRELNRLNHLKSVETKDQYNNKTKSGTVPSMARIIGIANQKSCVGKTTRHQPRGK
jgi:hypothetical protein